jgi:purine-binding chemotaxis protein CheW
MTGESITNTASYLTFGLEEKTFGIDVSRVCEVLGLSPITKVPQAPEVMRGVIKVHGNIVPIVDLRTKLGFPVAGETENTRILLMKIGSGDKVSLLGCVTDSVNDVVELGPAQIEMASDFGDRPYDFAKGIGKKDDLSIIILDVDRVFSFDDLFMLHSASEGLSKDSGDKLTEYDVMKLLQECTLSRDAGAETRSS